jgi:hypothetical protein
MLGMNHFDKITILLSFSYIFPWKLLWICYGNWLHGNRIFCDLPSFVRTDKWLNCLPKRNVSFKVCTQLWTAFFIFMFRSRLTVYGWARVYCVQVYYGNALWKWKVTWFLSKILQCDKDNRWIVLTWLMKFVLLL